MARTVIISVTLSLLVVAAGCQTGDTGGAYRVPRRTTYEPPAPADQTGASGVVNSTNEAELVEQVIKYRQDYRQSLRLLVDYYTSAGNSTRLNWAKEELRALERMPQYRYMIDPSVLPEDLKASARIPEADKLYFDAVDTQRQAEPFGPVMKDEEQLRAALQKYDQLIRRYPTSDKIKDAAYRSAGIYEYFKNYDAAVMFYKRTFQWDPSTTYPARFNAAQLLDKMGRRDEALPLYQEAATKEARHPDNKAYAERRIKELTGSKD